ncbi:MAG: DUF1552 domain-containing protein [Myxococcaceae bacterium]|nr:DUF1552 domain-containing protein [Myxococcaceae bacterium]
MAGAGSMAGFTRLLWPSVCEAQVTSPLRFVAVWTPHGRLDEYWLPKNGEMDFDINFTDASLQPLHPFRDQLLILDGLDYRVLYEQGTSGHEGGPVTFLTGSALSNASGEGLPKNESLDQHLAGRLGSATRFRSLQLNMYSAFGGQTIYDSLSFGPGGVRVPWERDPLKVYTRVFAALMTGAPSAAEVRAMARKKSLLDYLVRDASRLQSRLAGPEKAKLDAHISALRDIEKRLGGGDSGMCTKPAQPAQQTLSQLGQLARVPQNVQLMMDLTAQALACDLTRFVTINMLPQPSAPWLNISESLHDDLAHRVSESNATMRAQIRAKLNTFHRWNAEQIARLLGTLKGVNEGMGNVLDHSIVLWGNELGEPDVHASHGVPWVIAGGANGKFRTGRYLRLRPGKNPLQGWSAIGNKAPNAVAHNHVLVSIAQAFDQPINTFGQADYTGPLAALT